MNHSNILVSQWGYSMILYEFVQILKETPKTILVRVLETETVGDNGHGRPKVSPKWPLQPEYEREHGKPGNTIEKRYRLYKKDGRVFTRVDGYYKYYSPWDGQPKEEDHND